jgi:hypothetical protein
MPAAETGRNRIRKWLNEAYKRAKEINGIITSLPSQE